MVAERLLAKATAQALHSPCLAGRARARATAAHGAGWTKGSSAVSALNCDGRRGARRGGRAVGCRKVSTHPGLKDPRLLSLFPQQLAQGQTAARAGRP